MGYKGTWYLDLDSSIVQSCRYVVCGKYPYDHEENPQTCRCALRITYSNSPYLKVPIHKVAKFYL